MLMFFVLRIEMIIQGQIDLTRCYGGNETALLTKMR